MKQTKILQKLVNLLSRSENTPKVIKILTELEIKLTLKRPKSSKDGYLIEKSKINCYLGISYANSLPYVRGNKNFLKKELFFSDVQNILEEKIISSTYNNMDFFHSIKCDFLPHFSCLNCGYKYENILIVDAIPIYPNNFNLAKEKINYIKNNHKNLKCENCNKYFNRLILHIFHSLSSKK